MTSIEKLHISNIRSFGPGSRENPNIIEFYKPLTIIVGHNGAGKTTVIECLKYATTGDVPPNSDKGQAFVRDPRVAGVSEIKAQIRLRFRNLKGAPVVVNRLIQVTQKPNSKLEYKTREGTIQLKRNGETVSQSHRCADLDQFIPTYMGVSKAILNNVIFCHQEESNWPLLEKAKVKLKFDDIFSATRYNKALEELKTLRKTHTQAAREAKLKLETVQVKKGHAQRLQGEIAEKEGKIEKAGAQLETMKAKREKVLAILQRSEAVEEEARRSLADIRSLQSEESTLKAQLQSVQEHMDSKLTESLDELIALRNSFEADLRAAQRQLSAVRERRETAAAQQKALEQQVTEETIALGAEEARVDGLVQTSRSCDQAIVRFAQQHGCSETFAVGPFSQEDRNAFDKEAKQMLQQACAAVEAVRAAARAEIQDLDSRAGRLRSELSSLSTSVAAAKEEEEKSRRAIAELRKEIDESRELVAAMDDLELSAATLEAETARLRKEVGDSGEDAAAVQSEALRRIEEEKSRLNGEMQAIHQAAALSSQAAALDAKVANATRRHDRAFQTGMAGVGALLGAASNCGDLQAKATAVLEEKKGRLRPITAAIEAAAREEAQLSGQLAAARSRLKAAQDGVPSSADAAVDFPGRYTAAKAKVEKVKGEISMAKAATVIYNRFAEEAKGSEGCPLCKRGLEGEEHTGFLELLEKTVAAVPQSLEKSKRALARAEERLEALEKEKGAWEAMEQAKQRVAQEEAAVSAATAAHSLAEEETAEKRKAAAALEEETAKLTAAMPELEAGVRYLDEKQRLLEEQRELREKATAVGGSMTLPAAKERLRSLSGEQRTLSEKAEERRRRTAEAQRQLTEKLDALNVVKGKLLKASTSSSTVEALRGKIRDLENVAEAAEKKINGEKEKRTSLEEELALVEAEVAAARRKHDQREQAAQEKKDSLQGQIVALGTALARLQQQRPVEELEKELRERKKGHNERKERVRAGAEALKKMAERQEEFEEQLRTREQRKRQIGDSIRCKELENQIKAVRRKVTELEEKQRERTGKKAEDIVKEKEAATKAREKLQTHVDKLQAALDIYKSEVSSLKGKGREYSGVEEEHKRMVIELSTVQMACDDLDKYYRVLDKALMDYHTMKIEEINKSLKELWQTTYKGTDIDSIEIRADHEGNRSRPSYNYRVVMVKGDTELNMRGRCSAGQRVLASLVIRLALAEALGVNCGIIALDEPTTNLDRANVESFASALVSLIDARRRQTNFQLIVITHDEEFVQLLGRSDNADYYWRVAKDAHQQSTLTRCDISDLA